MSYVKKVAHGVSFVFLIGLLSAGLAYVIRIIMARNLGTVEYGLFSAVFTLITFFLFFRDLGVGHALAKYIPEYIVKNKLSQIKSGITFVFLFQMSSTFLLAVTLFFMAPYLAENYFKNPAAVVILRILILYLFGSVLFRLARQISSGFQNMRLYPIFEFLKNIIILLILLIFFHLDKGVFAPVIAYAAVCYIVVVITFPFLWKMFPFTKHKIENFLPVTKSLLLFGIPLFATGVSAKLISNIDTLILTNYASLTEVGVYNVVLPSAMIFLYFSSSVSAVIFPMFSELWTKKDTKRMTEALKMIQRYSFVIIIPPALVIISFARFFIETFFGIEYVSGTLALQILMIGMLFFVVAGINNSIISSIGKPQTVAKIVFLVLIFNTISNIILIPKFGIEGAALTTTLSYLITLILSTNRVVHNIPVSYPKIVWIKLVFAGFMFFSAINYIRGLISVNPWWELVVSVGIAGLVYLGIVYAYGIVNVKEMKMYFRVLRK